MATCAICRGPVLRGERFLVDDTEVVHRACASSGRPTLNWQLRNELEQQRVATAQRDGRIVTLETSLGAAQTATRTTRTALTAQQAEVRRLQQEVQRLTAELATRRTEPPQTHDTPDLDGAATRFSLLEPHDL